MDMLLSNLTQVEEARAVLQDAMCAAADIQYGTAELATLKAKGDTLDQEAARLLRELVKQVSLTSWTAARSSNTASTESSTQIDILLS